MNITPGEKDVLFDWFRTAKRSIVKISQSLEVMASNSQKQTDLFKKLLEMLENK